MKNQELNTLINRVKNKDEKAFEELYDKLWSTVYYIAYRYLKNSDSAKDIAQETFIIIYKKIEELNQTVAFNSWMNRIVLNLCHNYKDAMTIRRHIDIDNVVEDVIEENIEFLPKELLHNKDKCNELLDEISKLPEELKTVILLYYFEELSTSEISEILEVARITVYKRLVKAKDILRLQFSNEFKVQQGSISSAAILTIIFQQNSKMVCTTTIKQLIKENIKSNLGLKIAAPLKMIMVKAIVVTTVISAVIYGVIKISNPNNVNGASLIEDRSSDDVTLETFVGDINANLIRGWKVSSTTSENESLLNIIDKQRININYDYIDPNTRSMYVLYEKQLGNKSLLICEKYDSANMLWNVVYQIVNKDSIIIDKSQIVQWFEELEK